MKKQSTSHRTPQRQSLVSQTVEILREGIQFGRWKNHLPGERAFAKQLQVSRDTLRSALDELRRAGWVHARQRCRHSIIKNPRPGSHGRKPVLGFLSPSPFGEIEMPTTAIMDQLRALGVEVEFHASKACFSKRPEHALKRLTQAYPAAAWIILGSRRPMQQWFLRHGVPCLVLGSCQMPESLGSIDTDHRALGRHAGVLLLRKGHRRILLIMTNDRYDGELECESGLREGIEGQPDAQLQILHHDDHPGHLRQMLEKTLRSPSPPTACVVTHHRAIVTVMTHLLHKGMHIPRDMAVIHCGSSPAAAWITPAVSHYAIPNPVFVRHAVIAARSLLENPTATPKTIRLMPEFVKKESV